MLPVPLYQYLLNVSAYGCVCYLYHCTNICWTYQLMAVCVTCTIVPISVGCISLWLCVLPVPLYQYLLNVSAYGCACYMYHCTNSVVRSSVSQHRVSCDKAISQATSAQLQRCLRTNLISPITQIFIFCFSNLPPLSGWP